MVAAASLFLPVYLVDDCAAAPLPCFLVLLSVCAPTDDADQDIASMAIKTAITFCNFILVTLVMPYDREWSGR